MKKIFLKEQWASDCNRDDADLSKLWTKWSL